MPHPSPFPEEFVQDLLAKLGWEEAGRPAPSHVVYRPSETLHAGDHEFPLLPGTEAVFDLKRLNPPLPETPRTCIWHAGVVAVLGQLHYALAPDWLVRGPTGKEGIRFVHTVYGPSQPGELPVLRAHEADDPDDHRLFVRTSDLVRALWSDLPPAWRYRWHRLDP